MSPAAPPPPRRALLSRIGLLSRDGLLSRNARLARDRLLARNALLSRNARLSRDGILSRNALPPRNALLARDGILARYAVAWCYLLAVTAAEIGYALAPPAGQRAVLRWASTNVHNLHADPAGCLAASAFFPTGWALAWPALVALALFPACAVLGNWRTVVVCAAGHVFGTLVSEGIEDYRILHGAVPASARYLTDVGPSYVVVAAIAVTLLYGGWRARGAALLDLALLASVGGIFSGLDQLAVSAVGHVTAMATGVLAGSLAYWGHWGRRRSRRQARQARAQPAEAGPAEAGPAEAGPAEAGSRAADRADKSAQPRPRA